MNHLRSTMIYAFVFLFLLMSQPVFGQSLVGVDELQVIKGNKNARVVLIEFADYQCPFCARFHRETFPRIDKDYVLTDKVKFIFRNFPLERSHPYAFKAAEAAICSAEQGKFWAMHSRLFDSQDSHYFNDWANHAQKLALDSDRFTRCLESDATASRVKKDLADGKSAGVKVTPTFLLGVADPKTSSVKVMQTIEGAEDYSTFKKALDDLITTAK
ncbi:MAG TPA: thioredoxin domain-containing protein [Terriglobales bacterium]|jgi:protein-disulfide isomerase|nr:thioredoxin domain-containing protein [Terriglobales bacterium]